MKCEFDYEVDELNLAQGTRTRMTPPRLFINVPVPQYMMSRMTGYAYCSNWRGGLHKCLTTDWHMGRGWGGESGGARTNEDRLIRRTDR